MQAQQNTKLYWLILILATLGVGVIAGISGTILGLLLHWVQHIAYGDTLSDILRNENFLQHVTAASPQRRVIVLTICGCIAGFGWFLLHRYGKPYINLAQALRQHHPRLPTVNTLSNVLLQTVTIALGSPLGREVAPRELSALLTSWFTNFIPLKPKDARILLGCGAGAAFAAMYNIPLAGALYILEVLLKNFNIIAVLSALVTSAIAVMIAWAALGNGALYHLPQFVWNYSLLSWSILMGPLLGYLAFWFIRIAIRAEKKTVYDWRFPLFNIINFTMIGLCAIYLPALLGNGKSCVQLEFNHATSFGLTIILLLFRTLAVWSSFWVGARGGVLMPSLANGALLGTLGGYAWDLLWPNPTPGIYAVIGGTAFLAAAQNMPLTALIIICELTDLPINLLAPIALAVVGAVMMFRVLQSRHPL